MKTTAMAGALAALIGTALPAHAADAEKRFDGFYAGIELGAQRENGLEEDFWFTGHRTNLYYGGLIGYRRQFDSGLVVGLEGTFGDSRYKNEVRPINCPECIFPAVEGGNNNWEADYKADYSMGLGLNVGTAFGDEGNHLLYVGAGWVRTENGSVILSETFAPVELFDDQGWRLGAGYEWAMSDLVSLRLSADYVDYGSVDPDKVNGLTSRQANGTSQYLGKAAIIFSF